MALPISIGEIWSLVNTGINIYNHVKHDVPNEIADVADRIEGVKLYVGRLQKFVNEENALMSASPDDKIHLQTTLSKLKDVVSDIIVILKQYESKKGPWGLVYKSSTVSKMVFSYSGKPEELQRLGNKLDRRQDEIRQWQELIRDRAFAKLYASPPTYQPPSPGQQTKRNVLFVDPRNVGRSVIAEAYALLCQEWTERTGGVWPVNYILSSGIEVKSRSSTAILQQQLDMKLTDGNEAPIDQAISALFDGLPFTYAYKDDIRKRIMQRRSRGLTENLFAVYDFIIVFNRHNLASLENLRDALAKKHGQPAPAGKGKLVLLGQYGNTGKKEIWKPKKAENGSESLENWKQTAENIKTSLKGFLKQELGWTQPAPGTHQKA